MPLCDTDSLHPPRLGLLAAESWQDDPEGGFVECQSPGGTAWRWQNSPRASTFPVVAGFDLCQADDRAEGERQGQRRRPGNKDSAEGHDQRSLGEAEFCGMWTGRP